MHTDSEHEDDVNKIDYSFMNDLKDLKKFNTVSHTPGLYNIRRSHAMRIQNVMDNVNVRHDFENKFAGTIANIKD